MLFISVLISSLFHCAVCAKGKRAKVDDFQSVLSSVLNGGNYIASTAISPIGAPIEYGSSDPTTHKYLVKYFQQLPRGADVLRTPFISQCCDTVLDPNEISSTEVMECVNRSALANIRYTEEYFMARFADFENKRFGFVSYITKDIWNYSAYSFAINEAYAEHHRIPYMITHATASIDDTQDVRWNKIAALTTALQSSWSDELDYIVWLDADVIFLDMHMDLQAIVKKQKTAHIIASGDSGGASQINSGFLIVSNTAWSRDFLRHWWGTEIDRSALTDQLKFDDLYKRIGADARTKHIAILPSDVLNSPSPPFLKQTPKHQILHLMHEIDPYRERLFRDGFNAVCNHISGGRKLVPQLGLTQPVQLEITLDVYGDELDRLARAYKLKAEDGLNDAMETAALRDVVSRHYHALVTSGEEGAGLRDGQAKKKTFDLLLKNLNNRRKVNTEHFKEHHSNLTDWPESLKVVAEAGGLLLDVPSEYISFDDRVDAGTTMLALMREVRSIASIHSLSQVDSMLQRIHMEMGQLYWSNDEPNDFPMALQHFKESLAINRRLAVVGGNHLLVDALEAVALASSALGQFIAAHEAFDECIDATSDISNVLDRQYMQARVLTNYGVSMYQYAMSYQFSDDGEVNGNSGKHTNNAKDKIKVISSAEEKLRKAVHLFSKLNVNASDLFLVKANEYLSNISYLRQ